MTKETYFPIKTGNVLPGIPLPFSVYQKERKVISLLRSKLIQVIPSGHTLTQEQIGNFQALSNEQFFISTAEKDNYSKYLEDNLALLLSNENLEINERAEIIYLAQISLLNEILTDPHSKEKIKRAQNIIDRMVEFTESGVPAYQGLLDATAINYSTSSHSVNVASFALAIARHMGIQRASELRDLGIGGLLHDIGKSAVDQGILEKKGSLSEKEWRIMRGHPHLGVKLCEESHIVSSESITIIHQHQERCNGTGYPNGLRGTDIHLFGKIVGIADTFDAMTTEKPYRKAMDAFTALKLVKNECIEAYDEQIFQHLIKILEKEK